MNIIRTILLICFAFSSAFALAKDDSQIASVKREFHHPSVEILKRKLDEQGISTKQRRLMGFKSNYIYRYSDQAELDNFVKILAVASFEQAAVKAKSNGRKVPSYCTFLNSIKEIKKQLKSNYKFRRCCCRGGDRLQKTKLSAPNYRTCRMLVLSEENWTLCFNQYDELTYFYTTKLNDKVEDKK